MWLPGRSMYGGRSKARTCCWESVVRRWTAALISFQSVSSSTAMPGLLIRWASRCVSTSCCTRERAASSRCSRSWIRAVTATSGAITVKRGGRLADLVARPSLTMPDSSRPVVLTGSVHASASADAVLRGIPTRAV